MKWNNLKKNKCPKEDCECRLIFTSPGMESTVAQGCLTNAYMKCESCDFRISNKKFEEIVNKMYKPHTYPHERNEETALGELNNLGRKEVTEDFGDSHFLEY